MGTDIGTQGTKTILVDENGEFIAESFREYGVVTPKPAWAQQWPDVWLNAVVETIRETLNMSGIRADQLAGLALSGLYGGSGIPLDGRMEPLFPCLIWMDRRARKETQWVKENVPRDFIFSITGNYVDSYYGFTKMMWLRDNFPEIWSKTYQFATPKDYVIYKLTGELITDYSSAGNLGGLFDIHKREWSTEMSRALSIPLDKLPERIVRSSGLAGYVTREYAQLTGLLEGTPVIAGGVDAPVAQFSAGVLEEGEHVAMAGTSMCWGTVHGGENLTPTLISYPYVVYEEEKIYTFGGSATSGALARWFRDQFGQYEKEVQFKTGVSAYSLLELEAKNIPAGSEGLVALPYFMGERSPIWDPDARGTIFGLTLYHSKAHIYRALLEATAYSLKHNMEAAMRAGIKLNDECFIVGGVARSDFWVQILADVTGFGMKRLSKNTEAPMGDAFLAGLGTGLIDKPERIKDWLQFKPTVKPQSESTARYGEYYEIFKELYVATKCLSGKLAQL